MSFYTFAYIIQLVVILVTLGVWGLQDKKEHKVSGIYIVVFGIVWIVSYLTFLAIDFFIAKWFMVMGLALVGMIYYIRRTQAKHIDFIALLISSISFPFLGVLGLLMTYGVTALKPGKYPFIWRYFISYLLSTIMFFIVVVIYYH